MHIQFYVLRKEDFQSTHRDDGTLVMTHPFLEGTITWHPHLDPVFMLYKKIREFAQRHSVLMSPELESACIMFEQALEELRMEFEGPDEFEDEYLLEDDLY